MPETSDNFNSNPISFIKFFKQGIFCTITLLAAFLQIKKDDDPFKTHPKTMYVAVSAAVIFFIFMPFPVHGGFADHCLLFFGTASIASLTSVLFPNSLSPFVFAVFGLLYAIQLIYGLYRQYNTWKLLVLEFYNIWRKFIEKPQPTLPTLNEEETELYRQYNTWKLLVLEFFYNIWRKFIGKPQPILPL